MDYRSIPRISNSDLTEFRNHLFRYQVYKPAKAFAFGSALHQLLLEPKSQPNLSGIDDLPLLQHLTTQVRANRFCKWALRFTQKENVRLFEDPDTGLPCKTKIDSLYKGNLIIDFKSTSQRDYRRFIESCQAYDYDRQAAFYLDSVGAKRFVFIGIQKVEPYDLFYFEPTRAPRFIAQGRRKYKALLQEWKRQNYQPGNWGTRLLAA